MGRTGARFGAPPPKTSEPAGRTERQAEQPPAPKSAVGQTGARFGAPADRGTATDDRHLFAPGPGAVPLSELDGAATWSVEDTVPLFLGIPTEDLEPSDNSLPGLIPAPDEEIIDNSRSLIRPYMWTQGRTASQYDLRLETLVSTDWEAIPMARSALGVEHRMIVDMCIEVRSVAEVSAELSVPLGVARVLLGDLIGMGVVHLHDTATTADDQPELALMERVLSGLRQL